jgi:hypothetical protein
VRVVGGDRTGRHGRRRGRASRRSHGATRSDHVRPAVCVSRSRSGSRISLH